jgi:dynactin 1
MQDPNLAAARTVQLNTPSHSSTLLPSRISRLPQTSTSKSKKPIDETSRTPRLTSPTQKETKLQQIRLQQQQRLQKEQEEAAAQAKRREEEEEEEDNHQIEEKEDLKNDELDEQEELEEEEMVDQGESDQSEIEESNSVTYTDSNHVSRTSSTALPRGVGGTYPVYGSLAANLPVSKSEQMVPLKDYEELRLKLKILESKRQEDRERYREHEKVKEEAEQFLTLRNKLQGKIK